MKSNTVGNYKQNSDYVSSFSFFCASLLVALSIYVRFGKPNSETHAGENEITILLTVHIAYRILPFLKAEICLMKAKEISVL
jgi:hypothetical protein